MAETFLYEMIILSLDDSLCESTAISNCERECIQTLKEHTPSLAFSLTGIQNVLPNDPKTSAKVNEKEDTISIYQLLKRAKDLGTFY